MKSLKRIGIYGGTFSPPHLGHVSSAMAFLEQEKLDKLIIIPTFLPPHKDLDHSCSPEERFKMCELAFRDISNVCVSDMEIKRKGKSYTYTTLTQLREEYSNASFTLLCGTDMILSFDTWYRFEDVFKMSDVVYMRRENNDDISRQITEKVSEYREKYGAVIRELKGEAIDVSSSELRFKILNGDDVSAFLTKETEEFIRKWNIYSAKKKKKI